jgi:RNA polymerase-binding transcription factor DksA
MAKKPKKAPAKKPAGKKAKTVRKPTPPRKPVAAKTKAKVKPAAKAKPKAKPAPKVKVAPKAKAAPKAKPVVKAKPKAAPKQVAKPAKSAKTAKPAAPAREPKSPSVSMAKSSKKSALRDSILSRKATNKPIAFSLDEVRAIAQTVTDHSADDKAAPKGKSNGKTAKALTDALKPAKPNHVKAASLADILGFNPAKPGQKAASPEKPVPEKFKRFHKLLLDLRSHLTAGIELHSEETLKRSAKDDAGDLSSYGQHMADAGTDTFDRDFALSLVSSEQEALTEIEAAIKRIHDGSYGICEITGKPIAKERLLAVPFTRYSAEAQKQIERNRHRTRTQAGLFGEMGEDSGKIMDEDGGND